MKTFKQHIKESKDTKVGSISYTEDGYEVHHHYDSPKTRSRFINHMKKTEDSPHGYGVNYGIHVKKKNVTHVDAKSTITADHVDALDKLSGEEHYSSLDGLSRKHGTTHDHQTAYRPWSYDKPTK